MSNEIFLAIFQPPCKEKASRRTTQCTIIVPRCRFSNVFFGTIAVSVERWCRLRGNLLFYFKSRDHWSEPAGVIVIEDCQVRIDQTETLDHSTFGLVLAFGSSGALQHLATYTEAERDAWMAALKSASHHQMKSHLRDLRSKLNAKLGCSKMTNEILIGEEIKASASVIGEFSKAYLWLWCNLITNHCVDFKLDYKVASLTEFNFKLTLVVFETFKTMHFHG